MLELIRITFQIYLLIGIMNGLGGRLWEAKGYRPFHCFSSDQIYQYWLTKLHIEFNFLFMCQVFRLQNQVYSSTYKGILWWTQYSKVEIFLEQRKVAFLSPSKICENLNFSREIQIFVNFLGDKNTTFLCSKNISTLQDH